MECQREKEKSVNEQLNDLFNDRMTQVVGDTHPYQGINRERTEEKRHTSKEREREEP